MNTTKFLKATIVHRQIMLNLHPGWPLNISEIHAIRNEIERLLLKFAQNTSVQGRLVSYSIHKTCISRLFNFDVPVNYVPQLNGYQNPRNINSYKIASIKVSKECCLHWVTPSANVIDTSSRSNSFMSFAVLIRKNQVGHTPWSYIWELLFPVY